MAHKKKAHQVKKVTEHLKGDIKGFRKEIKGDKELISSLKKGKK
jgi:hypothetical protein